MKKNQAANVVDGGLKSFCFERLAPRGFAKEGSVKPLHNKTNYRLIVLRVAEQFWVVMVLSIVPPATSSSCSSLIDSGLLVSSLILGWVFDFWLLVLECRAREITVWNPAQRKCCSLRSRNRLRWFQARRPKGSHSDRGNPLAKRCTSDHLSLAGVQPSADPVTSFLMLAQRRTLGSLTRIPETPHPLRLSSRAHLLYLYGRCLR